MSGAACGTVATGADIGPEHQGHYVEITTRVTEEAAALGLGPFGQHVTVCGTVYHARRVRQAITQYRITLLFLKVPGHEALMPFNLGDCDPARLIPEG